MTAMTKPVLFSQEIGAAVLFSTTFYTFCHPSMMGRDPHYVSLINSSVSIVVSLDEDLIMHQICLSNL